MSDTPTINEIFQEYLEDNYGEIVRANIEYREKNGPTFMEERISKASKQWEENFTFSTQMPFIITETE
tara:strand:+ start:5557 stop:5760 length:204 start_codon:yes stop_codon:yes gene_type:complete